MEIDSLIRKEVKKILDKCHKIELNLKDTKIHTEISKREAKIESIFALISEKLEENNIRDALLLREAVKMTNTESSIPLKKIDKIFSEKINKENIVYLLDITGEELEEARIDFSVSYLRLIIQLKKELKWIEDYIDDDFKVIAARIKTNWRIVEKHQNMIDFDDVTLNFF